MELGQVLIVLVKKEIVLNEERYFVLEDPETKNVFLMPTRYYVNYPIEIGQRIQVKIDKINCSGEVFVEPQHPYYEEGKAYWFPLRSIEKHNDHYLVEVEDIFQHVICVVTDQSPYVENNKAKLWVKGLRKGLPILCCHVKEMLHYQKGNWYTFNIIAEKIIEDKSYFLLQGNDGRYFLLPSEWYASYKFEIGQTIRCYVSDIDLAGEPHLEPEHPTYRHQQKIKLAFLSTTFSYLSDISKKHLVYKLTNEQGDIFYLPVKYAPREINVNEWKWYQIDKFKKGKILVKPLENETNVENVKD